MFEEETVCFFLFFLFMVDKSAEKTLFKRIKLCYDNPHSDEV